MEPAEFDRDPDYKLGFSGPAPNLTKAEIDEIAASGFADPVWFCQTFLPTKFPKKIPWVHRGILAIVTGQTDFLLKYGELDKIVRHFTWRVDPNDEKSPEHPIFKVYLDENGEPYRIDMDRAKFTEIIMPRGFSKTTIVGIACMLYKIVYREHKFIVYISETARAAEMQLGNVRYELSTNTLIKVVFGDLSPGKGSELKWAQDIIQTTTGINVVARGRLGQIRGLNINANRPDCILFDDVEDKESVKTEEQRDKSLEWMYGDVMPAIGEMDETATILGLGTVLHREALLMKLRLDPDWTTLQFGAIDKDGDALWADNMSLKKLAARKLRFATQGKLHLYYMEYESTIRAGDGAAKFSGPFIIRPELRMELDCIAMCVDPAISEEKDADFCAMAVAGITTKGIILLMDMWMKVGALPNEQVDRYFSLSEYWSVEKHGVEAIAYQKALVHLIRGEMFRRKRYFVIEEVRHGKTGKDERILGILQPRYANGYIAHLKHFPEYEAQLLDYPNGKKDGPDVFAQTIKLLDPYAANMANTEDTDPTQPEYGPRKKDWRKH